MGSTTGISWTDSTWNPWQGCRRVSPGCDNCYMHRDKARYGQDPGRIHRSSNATFLSILSPKKFPPGSRVFVCSWSDFFLEEADLWRDEAWEMIQERPDLTFLLVTKRPENIAGRLPGLGVGWPWPHVWLGVTAEDQVRADERIPVLLDTPAAHRFVSVEPMLGPVSLRRYMWPVHARWPSGYMSHQEAEAAGVTVTYHRQELVEASARFLELVIAGGESGPNARPVHPSWVRALRDECEASDTGFHFKQWGANRLADCGHPMLDKVEIRYRCSTASNARRLRVPGCTDAHVVLACRQCCVDGAWARPSNWGWEISHKKANLTNVRGARMLDGRTHDDMPGEVRPDA